MLSDFGSETGTWVTLKQVYAECQFSELQDLHDALNREFRVAGHCFTVQPDTQVEVIDELEPWLNNFGRILQELEQTNAD